MHSAEAVDVATGISAKAQNYKSKSGAKEHARPSSWKEESSAKFERTRSGVLICLISLL